MEATEVAFRATEHANAAEALQHLEVSDAEHALLIAGRYFTVAHSELEKLLEGGVEFAYVIDHFGKIMTIPAG